MPLLDDPTLPVPTWKNLKGAARGLMNMVTPPDPYEAAGQMVKQARGGDYLGALETGYGAMPTVGSFTHPLYHGSPQTGLTVLQKSERGPMGPGVYASTSPNIAEQYKRGGGEMYNIPHEKLDIYRGEGHRADEEYYGWKKDKERLLNAIEPEKRDVIAPLIEKMSSSEGYPLYYRLSQIYGGDEGAQNLFKRAGFHGLSGLVDGPETVLFDDAQLTNFLAGNRANK